MPVQLRLFKNNDNDFEVVWRVFRGLLSERDEKTIIGKTRQVWGSENTVIAVLEDKNSGHPTNEPPVDYRLFLIKHQKV